MRNWDVFSLFLAVRILSIIVVQTFFVADEYWQSLEVAHNLVFKYGHLTWEWSKGIRSYIPPLLIAGLYKILQISGLDCAAALIYGPRVLQSLLSAYSDLCFYKWSGTKKWAVFCLATSWFWFYTGSRTIINSFECALTTIALSRFPWPGKGIEDNFKFLWIVALLFVIRPTSTLVWIPICLYHFKISKRTPFSLVLSRYLPIGVIVLLVSTLIDSLSHGSFIVTPYNFLKFNVLEDLATFYGVQPWHWYLSNGLPAILGIQFIPFVMATLVILNNKHLHPNELVMLGTMVFAITVYSFLPHKEFRFILPLLPLVLYVSSMFLSLWSKKASFFSIWLVAAIIFVGNLVPSWYLGVVHQRGTIDVMEPLRNVAVKDPINTNFIFLMPCHSTPLYSHLHLNVTTRFLTCTPNFSKLENYLDEAEQFYNNPEVWLRRNYPSNETLPSHIISFDILVPAISDILSRYNQTNKIFHTSLPSTSRVGKYVIIHERIDY